MDIRGGAETVQNVESTRMRSPPRCFLPRVVRQNIRVLLRICEVSKAMRPLASRPRSFTADTQRYLCVRKTNTTRLYLAFV